MAKLSYHHVGGDRPLLGTTIPEHLRKVAERCPDCEALVSVPQGVRLTYREFVAATDRLAKGLLALGVRKGDRVGIWAMNNVEWVQLQIASAAVGAILVNINPAYRTGELRHALGAARVQTLFLMPAFKRSDYAGMVRRLCPEIESSSPDAFAGAELPELRQVVVFDPERPGAAERPASGFLLWREVLERGETLHDAVLAERLAELETDDPINIQFTSGTTGFPKPVVLSHHNILNNAACAAKLLGFTETDRLCVPVPFYHCFGMVLSNLACLCAGACIVIPASHFMAGAVLAAVEKERCTALHGVPTMFVAELQTPGFKERDLSCLRTGIMAGAPCPPELMRRVIGELGIERILIGYGQTEASPLTHITRPADSFERRVHTVGTNMPHQECKIIDPATGRVQPCGEPGEVCTRGYNIMKGYFEMPEATAEAIDPDSWLRSGDLGVMDEEGYLAITGRLKEMIIRGGENIYPAEIEALFCRHPQVAQAAVFGIPDPKWGEEVGAWIQLVDGAETTEEELLAFARETMAHFKVPAFLRVVGDFPMTVTGKIQKFRIRERMEAELAAR